MIRILFILLQGVGALSESRFSIEVGTTKDPIPAVAADPHFSYDEDKEILERWLNRTFSILDLHTSAVGSYPSLKGIAENITFVMDYDKVMAWKRAGLSAEDDHTFYVYPKTEFYHAGKSPGGKIRLVVSALFIRQLRKYEAVETAWGQESKAATFYVAGFFAHELLHAAQYAHCPVRNFHHSRDQVIGGIISPDLLQDLHTKVDVYEAEGFFLHHLFQKDVEVDEFNEQITALENAHPEWFMPGGKLESVKGWRLQPILHRSFDLLSGKANEIRVKFKDRVGVFMYGLYRPAEIVLALHEASVRGRTLDSSTLNAFQAEWDMLFHGSQSDQDTMTSRHSYNWDTGIYQKFYELLREAQKRNSLSYRLLSRLKTCWQLLVSPQTSTW